MALKRPIGDVANAQQTGHGAQQGTIAQLGMGGQQGSGGFIEAKANDMHPRPLTPEDVAAFEFAKNFKAPDYYSFIQLADVIAVDDSRGNDTYTDRRITAGRPVCTGGRPVRSIRYVEAGWFDVEVERGVTTVTYRVPVTNVRSARR